MLMLMAGRCRDIYGISSRNILTSSPVKGGNMMMIYNMDVDLRGIIKANANNYNMDIEEYFNFVVLCGLYLDHNMREGKPQEATSWTFETMENYLKGIKGIDVDDDLPPGSWFDYYKLKNEATGGR